MTFRQGPDDTLILEFEDAAGGLTRSTLTLEQAAALQRGEVVAGFGLSDYFTLEERIAIAQADLDGIRARKAEMQREYPGIDDGEWSE